MKDGLSTHSGLFKGHSFVEIMVENSGHTISSTSGKKTVLKIADSFIDLFWSAIILLFFQVNWIGDRTSCIDWSCFVLSVEHLYNIVLKIFCFLRFY